MPQFKLRDETASELHKFASWVTTQALPLWCRIGKDGPVCFEEQLDFSCAPLYWLPRRTMVQARQISVYSLASKRGWINEKPLVLEAAEHLFKYYWSDNTPAGWIFSAYSTGEPCDPTRDLYAHAFVLFGLSNLLGVGDDKVVKSYINRTLETLNDHFQDCADGGFFDCIPAKDLIRHQNPHMHLLEAFLALFEETQERRFLHMADGIVNLALNKFINEGGALFEEYDSHWRPYPSASRGRIEPGHQFEWSWLLRRYESATGTSMQPVLSKLLCFALANGFDQSTGRIVDGTRQDGTVVDGKSRVWPHTEALRCLAQETRLGHGDYQREIQFLVRRIMSVFCVPALNGGWIDRVGENDEPLSESMPASTLYHIVTALDESNRLMV